MWSYVGHILLLILYQLGICVYEVFFNNVSSVEVLLASWVLPNNILLTKIVHKTISCCLIITNMRAYKLLHCIGFGINSVVQLGVVWHTFGILIEFLNMIELALYQLGVLLLLMALWIQPFLSVLHIMNIMQPRLIILSILLQLCPIICIIIACHGIHYNPMCLILFLNLAHSRQVVFVYGLGLAFFARATVLGSGSHNL